MWSLLVINRHRHQGYPGLDEGQWQVEGLDLRSVQPIHIKPAAEQFNAAEDRLDVLFLNAGVMTPPAASKTADGYDLEMGINCLAPFLLSRLTLDKI